MIRVFSPTRHGIPLLAIAMVSFAGWSIAAKHDPRVAASPPIAAPTNPYDDTVAGTGIVEPASEVIALAIERGGVVSRIDVVAGDRVKAGRPLFAIDDRDYRAAVAQDEAAVAAAKASKDAIDQNLILQRDAIDQPSASALRSITPATPSSPVMLGRRASALKPLPPMPTKPTRALPPQRPLSPARSSRLRSCRPSARKPGQSLARRKRYSTRRGSISTRPWSRRRSTARSSRSMCGSANMRRQACCPIR